MLARRLLIAGPGGAIPVVVGPDPAGNAFDLTAAANGGWPGQTGTWYEDGISYFGWISGDTQFVRAAAYDDDTHSVEIGTIYDINQDDHHNAPGLIRRSSDGKLVAFVNRHSGPELRRVISSNADDVTTWGTADNLDSVLGGTAYTYANLFEMSNGDLWVFYRDDQGGTTSVLCYSVSTDDGATWAAQTEVYENPGEDTYWRIEQTGDRFDFVVSDGTLDADNASAYHFYRDTDGTWHESDGTDIGSPIFNPGDLTLAYDGSGDGVRLPFDLIGNAGNPIAVLSVHSGGDYDYKRIAWNGSAWSTETVANSGGSAAFVEGGIALDPDDPTAVYYSRLESGVWEMFKAIRTAPSTYSETALTSGSSAANFYPVRIRNHGDHLKVIWLHGSFVSSSNFNLGIRGTST